jgi:nucleoid-associated protein YgaU
MTRRNRIALLARRAASVASAGALLGSGLGALLFATSASAVNFPITQQQRGTANKVAQDGVALSELAPNAPDSYTVKRGDTLWAISKIFLKSPWRWPELWGMNLEQIRNPHLIYPGQQLFLDKSNGRARLRVGQAGMPGGTVKLSPRVRSQGLDSGAIPSIPFNLIEPFLNEAVIFERNELETAPRIVAAQEGRVLLSRGDLAYVRGELPPQRDFRIFREPKALLDPGTKEVLGYEAVYVGTAEYTRAGDEKRATTGGGTDIVPATFQVTGIRLEANIGDRLSPVPPSEFSNYAPHAPAGALAGQIVSIYGEAVAAGQNQIVSLNRGARDGVERGHVLALWRDGSSVIDKTDSLRPTIKLPDERHGTLFVFRVFNRMSYALILSVQDPVRAGDRFTQP